MVNEILQYVLLTLSVIYLTLGVHVMTKSWRQRVNQLFFMFCVSLSLWAFGYAFMVNADSYLEANRWRLLSSLGWSYFYAHWYYFSVELTENRRPYVKPTLIGAYVLATWYFFKTCLLDPQSIFLRTFYGWVPVYPNNLNQYLFTLYYMVILGSAIHMVYKWGVTSPYMRHREQSNIICISVIISLILGGTTDTVLPMLGFVTFPMAIVFIVIGVAGIWFGIIKYKMMGITEGFIADNLVRAVDTPIFILDGEKLVERVNPAGYKLLDKKAEDVIGQSFESLLSLESHVSSRLKLESQIENQELVLNLKDDESYYYLMTATCMTDDFGDFISEVVILNDITEMKKAEEIIQRYNRNLEIEVERRTDELEVTNVQLQKEIESRKHNEKHAKEMLYFDELTSLPNRLYFKEKTSESIEDAKRISGQMAILFMDLDDFKYINESLGHYMGDELLKHVGVLLTANLPDCCIITRNSGDEFHILVNDLSGVDIRSMAENVATTILYALRRPFCIDGKELFVTASIGISIFPEDGTEYITLVKNADSALYAAKQQGKNAVVFTTPLIMEKMERMAYLRHRLHRAVENMELCLYYQPQVSLETGRILGFEALLRWPVVHECFISPSEFIPLAEENGLIIPIGYWVIEVAARKAAQLKREGYGELIMAVNISVNQLKQMDFVDRTMAILEAENVPPWQMEFEVTERVGFKGLLHAEETLCQLQAKGIRISIDDFGTDYSSFMNIKRLPIDKIKIAMEFVSGVMHNSKDAAIVQTMVEMSRNMGLEVIAEGVEDAEQVAYLQSIQCESVQGYYFYKPMSEENLKKVLDDGDYVLTGRSNEEFVVASMGDEPSG